MAFFRRFVIRIIMLLNRLLYFLRGIIFYSFGRDQLKISKTALKAFREIDSDLFQTFSGHISEARQKYNFLFRYFVTGFLLYRGDASSLASYPGAPSKRGPHQDRMEGFTRILPLICSWLSSGRKQKVELLTGGGTDLEEIVSGGLISGTDPDSSGYWGTILQGDARICEATDVALSIWLVRKTLWRKLNCKERKKIIDWLLKVNGKEVYDNNWHLFPVIINEVASTLGYEHNDHETQAHYSRFKSFYRGDGWFSDGPKNVFDYYNAWSIYYGLFWLDQINPKFDPEFIKNSLRDLLQSYLYVFTPQGIPILGRSICYRMAASVPVLAAYLQEPPMIEAGLARRALDVLWTYFILKGGVLQGRVSQGYFGEELRLLDNYSGPASCLWGLRSLVLAFYCPEDSPFWNNPPIPLPIEVSDYHITVPSIGWEIKGIKETQEVIIETGRLGKKKERIKNYTRLHQWIGFLTGRPFRPQNRFIKYELPQYSSKNPFGGCL